MGTARSGPGAQSLGNIGEGRYRARPRNQRGTGGGPEADPVAILPIIDVAGVVPPPRRLDESAS
jgi:hypothetical protein